jgi:hypothetical protein
MSDTFAKTLLMFCAEVELTKCMQVILGLKDAEKTMPDLSGMYIPLPPMFQVPGG